MMSDFKYRTVRAANERIVELKYERDTYSHNLDKMLAEIERLRRPACGTEQVWLDTIRHDDEQALLWFRAMQRESELKKKAMEEAERWRNAAKRIAEIEAQLQHHQVYRVDAAMEETK